MSEVSVEWEQTAETSLPGGYTIKRPEAKVILRHNQKTRQVGVEDTTGPRLTGDTKPTEGIVESLRDLAEGGLINSETFDDIEVNRGYDDYSWVIEYNDMPWAFSSKDFGPSFTYYAAQALRRVSNDEA